MAQDDVREFLKKQKGRSLTIREIAVATRVDYRTAARNLQDLGKWNELVITKEGQNRSGKKKFRLKE